MRIRESILRPASVPPTAAAEWLAFVRSPVDFEPPVLEPHPSGEVQFELGLEEGERVEGVLGFVLDGVVVGAVDYRREAADFWIPTP